MKLVVMIPCLNEETTLPAVLATIPPSIDGIDDIVTLIIDDGSDDETVRVAREHGITEFVYHPRRRGLAMSLRDGFNRALEIGADIVVLTDGDNQYPQERIPDLIRPVFDGVADIVIADRQTATIEHFSPTKKFLQRLGTTVTNAAAGSDIPDVTSGFRAYSKEAAIKFTLIGRFNFATETTVSAANKNLAISYIKIQTNAKTRESRLFKSNWEHVRKSTLALFNALTMNRPYAVFLPISLLLMAVGVVLSTGVFWGGIGPAGHIELLVVGMVLLNVSFISLALAVIANLVRANRVLVEDAIEFMKRDTFGR